MSAIVAGLIMLVGVTGCGSTQGHPGSGVLAGAVTFPSVHGTAALRVFDGGGRMVAHVGVSSGQPRFRFALPAGRYLVLLKVVARPGEPLPRCMNGTPDVQVGRTTHIFLGRSCNP